MFRNLSAKNALEKYNEMGALLKQQKSVPPASSSSEDRKPTSVAFTEEESVKGAYKRNVRKISISERFSPALSYFDTQYERMSRLGSTSIHNWRKEFNSLVWLYNNAYSLSPNAVIEKATTTEEKDKGGGNGENQIPPSLRDAISLSTPLFSAIEKLKKAMNASLDTAAVGRAELPEKTSEPLRFTVDIISKIEELFKPEKLESAKKLPIIYYIARDYRDKIDQDRPESQKRDREDPDSASSTSKKQRI